MLPLASDKLCSSNALKIISSKNETQLNIFNISFEAYLSIYVSVNFLATLLSRVSRGIPYEFIMESNLAL